MERREWKFNILRYLRKYENDHFLLLTCKIYFKMMSDERDSLI